MALGFSRRTAGVACRHALIFAHARVILIISHAYRRMSRITRVDEVQCLRHVIVGILENQTLTYYLRRPRPLNERTGRDVRCSQLGHVLMDVSQPCTIHVFHGRLPHSAILTRTAHREALRCYFCTAEGKPASNRGHRYQEDEKGPVCIFLRLQLSLNRKFEEYLWWGFRGFVAVLSEETGAPGSIGGCPAGVQEVRLSWAINFFCHRISEIQGNENEREKERNRGREIEREDDRETGGE